jgi:transposase
MPNESLARGILLPELKFIKEVINNNQRIFFCEKESEFEVCPKCATKSSTIYDHVFVTIRDAPLRQRHVILKIKKRRFLCKTCKKPFREPVQGIFKGFRTTQRLRGHIRWAAENYSDLSRVARYTNSSSWLVYKSFYEQIDLVLREYKSPWPKTIGIDEHSFLRSAKKHRTDFVTVFIDYNNKRMKEVVLGKSIGDLVNSHIKTIPGRENVKNVVLDLSPTFRSFAKEYFPCARLIADKFHVIKLIHPILHQYRKELIDKEGFNAGFRNPIGRLLVCNRNKLQWKTRNTVDRFLDFSPELKEIYWLKERIYRFYRIKGEKKARKVWIEILDAMALSKIPEIQSIRGTFRLWANEILNYFSTKLTNGRTEGYNRKAKLIQRCAYGFRSFKNYRLKLLYLCR